MNEHALKCLESIVSAIRAGRLAECVEVRRSEILTHITTTLRTSLSYADVQCDTIMCVANAIYHAYSVGRLDGYRDAITDAEKPQ